jgi:hypothetical protein
MKIAFTTKLESKHQQEEAFLALSPHERFLNFIALSKAIKKLYPSQEETDNDNFVIDLSGKKSDA